MSDSPFPYPPAERYSLRRDGVEVFAGTEADCWRWIHRAHSYSVHHALRFEGYSMVPVEAE